VATSDRKFWKFPQLLQLLAQILVQKCNEFHKNQMFLTKDCDFSLQKIKNCGTIFKNKLKIVRLPQIFSCQNFHLICNLQTLQKLFLLFFRMFPRKILSKVYWSRPNNHFENIFYVHLGLSDFHIFTFKVTCF